VSRAVSPSLTGPDVAGQTVSRASEHEFDAVYEQYAEFVWRSLRRLGVVEAHLADATQDVFVVVHRGLERFEARSELRTWLFGIVLRVASEWRKKTRRRATEPLPDAIEAPERTPFEQAVRSEATELLHRLLDRLSSDQRAVFVLVEMEGFSLPEAAAALGANLHTATSRLKTARRKFEADVRRHMTRSERGSK
jgi:RNA polymerase sigma-70 factor (ECF subfamily)